MNATPDDARLIVVDAGRLLDVFEATRRLDAYQRPALTRRLLVVALANLCPATGVVQLTREELAAELMVGRQEISFALTSLERLGVIRRERRPTPGKRGSGEVAAFVNPALAWAGPADARARWQGAALIGRRQRNGGAP